MAHESSPDPGREKRRKDFAAMEREALRDTLKSPAGRVVLRTLLRRCGIYEGSQGEFAEGRRALGLELKQVLEELDPFAYADLLRDDIKARRDG